MKVDTLIDYFVKRAEICKHNMESPSITENQIRYYDGALYEIENTIKVLKEWRD